MILGIITLFIAVVISIVSAYYSILGLTAIFASAVIPVMIMGGSLEAGKVITAVWLHANWKRAELQYKLYLVPAVIFLMVLTSMGVFGFLSKAHSDQSLVSGDSMAKVAIYDEKIKVSRDNIDANRKALKQMDEAVDQVMARSSDEKGADKAVAIRRGQQKERARLLGEIESEQKKIIQYNEDRAPLAAENRKIESEVGPIKYIAALIYGDNPDTNVLERAVRWVIILIVSVFDPLAIVLILAGIKQIEWSKEDKEKSNYAPTGSAAASGVTIDDMIAEEQPVVESKPIEEPVPVILPDPEPDLEAVNAELSELAEDKEVVEPEIVPEEVDPELELARKQAEELAAKNEQQEQTIVELKNDFNILTDLYSELLTRQPPATMPEPEPVVEVPVVEEPVVDQIIDAPPPPATINVEGVHVPTIQVVEPDLTVYDDERLVSKFDKEELAKEIPDLERPGDYLTPPDRLVTEPDHQPRSDFGSEFPGSPEKGDMFLRTDFKPSRLFKWNDFKWIEVSKNITDAYSYNDSYIQFLADKIHSGEYSLDDLTEVELQQIQQLLGGNRG